MTDIVAPAEVPKTFLLRDDLVMLDSDIAEAFGVSTKQLNQQVRRNPAKFTDRYAFQTSEEEFEDLKSQIVTSKRGGRRTPPWVFTERGVVMAASVLRSERAVHAMHHIVDVFIEARHAERRGQNLQVPTTAEALTPASSVMRGGAFDRLQIMMDRLLDSMIEPEKGVTVREEAENVLRGAISNLKERLAEPGLKNEQLAAEIQKLIAETQVEREISAKTEAEAELTRTAVLARKMRMALEAERFFATGNATDFLAALADLSKVN